MIFVLPGCALLPEDQFIAVNLVGYEADSPKQSFVINTESTDFKIVRLHNSEVVLSGRVEELAEADSISGDRLAIIDFSGLNTPGEYVIKTSGEPDLISHPFKIEENVYHDALIAMVKSYYYHRCGTAVGDKTEWSYNVCHLDDAPFFRDPETSKRVTGGWHDAGDYNKFSGNTALSAGLLLYAYDLDPAAFTDHQLDIPESGNGIPDILDEVSWALKWLLKMQRDDGAVYHKVSQEKWIGEFLPDQDPSIRYIFDVSSAATASFAAATALGARHLEEFNPSFSLELYSAAQKAWDFLENNPGNEPEGGFKNPPGVTGGEYGDPSDLDERLWASAELFNLTDSEVYLDFFIQNYNRLSLSNIPPISWRDAESLALRAFLSSNIPDRYSNEREVIKTHIINHADSILEVQKANNYKNLLQKDQYYWGSNSVGLAYAFDLIHAFEISGELEYRLAALDQLHFILGRNPLNLSMVTGVGSVSVKNPYHQLSEMGGFSAPVPGMLVGGPNNHLLLNDRNISTRPAKNYEDTFKNYLVNEPAINFTAILVFVTTAFSTSTKKSDIATTSK
ncbi:MAG: glycoside hydrolase family 9 protein [Balneolaceae bacterium]|nr:glycoside hydrolase family 9 protein [Balneolaceae bacterium]